jgi:hypothetical protein
MTQRERIARHAAACHGVELVEVRRPWIMEPTLCVLSTGAGLLMATLDHLAGAYPLAGLVGGDLPGALPPEKRAAVVDYSLQTWPTLLVVWASLRDPEDFIRAVARRQSAWPPPHRLWVYHQGLGRAEDWSASMGAQIVDELWAPRPLGEIDDDARWTAEPA